MGSSPQRLNRWHGILTAALLLATAPSTALAAAGINDVFDTAAGVPKLGEALGFGLFNVTGLVNFAGGNTTVTGSVGVGPGATAEIGGDDLNALNGDVVIDPDSGDGDLAGLLDKAQGILDYADLPTSPVVRELDAAYASARALYLNSLALTPDFTYAGSPPANTFNATLGGGTPTLTVFKISGGGVGGLGDLKGNYIINGDANSYVVIQVAKMGDNTGWTLNGIPYEHVIYAITDSFNGNGGSISGTILGVPALGDDGSIELKSNNQNSPIYGRVIGRITQWVSGSNTRGWDFGDLPETLGYTTLASTVIRQGGENRTVDGLLVSPNGVATTHLYPVTSGYYPATLGGAQNIAATQQGPSHLISKNGGQPNISKTLVLGDIVDMEPNGQPDTQALGDDATANNNADDEDRVTLPGSITPGGSATFSVRYVNENADARLYAFVDWNGDGDFEDLNEQLRHDVAETAGSHVASSYNFVFTVPSILNGVAVGRPLGARFRVATVEDDNGDPINLGPAGPAPNGEVEDYLIQVGSQLASADWGDLPAPKYPTTLAQNGPRHTFVPGLRLGAVIDTETNGQPSAAADGDDLNSPSGGSDDEDGVQIPLLIAGDSVSLVVTSSGAGVMNGFIDWNNNGVLDDAGESYTLTFVGAGTQNLSLTVPLGAVTGQPLGARFRLSAAGGLTPVGPATEGEVEDYLVTVLPAATPLDFGDAPTSAQSGFVSSYPTLLANSAARHVIVPGYRLGTNEDAETDGQPSAGATGDDVGGAPPDDEDGVLIPSVRRGFTLEPRVTLVNSTALNAFVDAWFDWNQDGDWDDAGEKVAHQQALVVGLNVLPSFVVPLGAELGSTYARFRLSDVGGLPPTGLAANGEVEDYVVFVNANDPAQYDWGDLPAPYPTLSTDSNPDGGPRHAIVPTLRLGTVIDAESNGQPSLGAVGDDNNSVLPVFADDEDGVSLSSLTGLTRGAPATVPVSVFNDTGGNATLWAWIDFNGDKVMDAGETATTTVGPSASQQLVNLGFAVPLNAVANTYARFRLGTVASEVTLATGLASNGEVEDYPVTTQSVPTAAVLSYFRAIERHGQVRVSWGTLIETDLLGFRLERASGTGAWVTVTEGVIPARGGGYQPQAYGLVVGDASVGSRYRLLSVNLRGQAKVLGEAGITAATEVRTQISEGNLRLEFRGEPRGQAVLETTVDLEQGPWEPVGEAIQLDASGTATVSRALEAGEPMRFFRVRE